MLKVKKGGLNRKPMLPTVPEMKFVGKKIEITPFSKLPQVKFGQAE